VEIIKQYLEKAGVTGFLLEKKLKSFKEHDDIGNEFSDWILNGEYAVEREVRVEGYSAKDLAGMSKYLNGEGAFSLLILLRENPQKGLRLIREGFKLK